MNAQWWRIVRRASSTTGIWIANCTKQSIFSIDFVVSSFSLLSIKFSIVYSYSRKDGSPRNNHFIPFCHTIVWCIRFFIFFLCSFVFCLLCVQRIHDTFINVCWFLCQFIANAWTFFFSSSFLSQCIAKKLLHNEQTIRQIE